MEKAGAPSPLPSSNSIATDVVVDIMARLPVKSLMRLRLISKLYFSITASSNFITSHLALSRSSGYAALPASYANPPPTSITILDKSFSEVLRPEIFFPSSELDTKYGFHYCILVGSCHGLLCYANCKRGWFGDNIFLWNPLIKKFKSIVGTSLNSDMLHDITTVSNLGFTFDGKKNDYLIIRIVITAHKEEPSSQAEIYSLTTDSWRKLIFSPSNSAGRLFKFVNSRCTFVNGALHWLARYTGDWFSPYGIVILSFKVENEEFKVIQLPQCRARGEVIWSINLVAARNGSLVVPVRYHSLPNLVDVEPKYICRIWTMNKDAEGECWTEEMTPSNVSWCYGCTEDDELMLNQNSEVCLYNLETGTSRKTSLARVTYVVHHVVPFKESLVLL